MSILTTLKLIDELEQLRIVMIEIESNEKIQKKKKNDLINENEIMNNNVELNEKNVHNEHVNNDEEQKKIKKKNSTKNENETLKTLKQKFKLSMNVLKKISKKTHALSILKEYKESMIHSQRSRSWRWCLIQTMKFVCQICQKSCFSIFFFRSRFERYNLDIDNVMNMKSIR